MKIAGKKIEGRNVEIVVIPRPLGEDIAFRCEAVLSMDAFDKLCPMPLPPMRMVKGGIKVPDTENVTYREALTVHSNRRMAFLILESLKATPELEWETVKMDTPSTWENWEKELEDSGFSAVEINRVRTGVFNANCLNEALIETARENFLRGSQAEQVK